MADVVPSPLDEVFPAAVSGASLEQSIDEVFVGLQLGGVGEGAVRAEVGYIKLGDDVVIFEVGKAVAASSHHLSYSVGAGVAVFQFVGGVVQAADDTVAYGELGRGSGPTGGVGHGGALGGE